MIFGRLILVGESAPVVLVWDRVTLWKQLALVVLSCGARYAVHHLAFGSRHSVVPTFQPRIASCYPRLNELISCTCCSVPLRRLANRETQAWGENDLRPSFLKVCLGRLPLSPSPSRPREGSSKRRSLMDMRPLVKTPSRQVI